MRERTFAIFTAKLYRALSKRDGDLGDFASKIILKALKQSAKFQLMILEIFGAKKIVTLSLLIISNAIT